MKKFFLLNLLLANVFVVSAQTSYVDSLKGQLDKIQPDTSKLSILELLAEYYANSKPDSALHYARLELKGANSLNNGSYASFAFANIGEYYYFKGNYPVALQWLFKGLQLSESTKDSLPMSYCLCYIGNTYKEYDDMAKAKQYYLRHKIISERINGDILFSYTNLGYAYAMLNMLDSALFYEQQAYTIAIKSNDRQAGSTLFDLAIIQQKLNNRTLALAYYKIGINAQIKYFGSYSKNLSKGYQWLSGFYKESGSDDSAIYYAHIAFNMAKNVGYTKGVLMGARMLSDIYDLLHQKDSELYYLKMFISVNDSLYNRNRTSSVENLTFSEQVRQQEKEQELIKAKKERKLNIGYALLAIGIITFIILFLLLSRKIITSEKLIEILGVLALLMVFEYIYLLLHPLLERITGDSPLLELTALVCSAAILVPLHYKLEKWAVHTLIEKNKRIRLSAAKRTIEKLENNKVD